MAAEDQSGNPKLIAAAISEGRGVDLVIPDAGIQTDPEITAFGKKLVRQNYLNILAEFGPEMYLKWRQMRLVDSPDVYQKSWIDPEQDVISEAVAYKLGDEQTYETFVTERSTHRFPRDRLYHFIEFYARRPTHKDKSYTVEVPDKRVWWPYLGSKVLPAHPETRSHRVETNDNDMALGVCTIASFRDYGAVRLREDFLTGWEEIRKKNYGFPKALWHFYFSNGGLVPDAVTFKPYERPTSLTVPAPDNKISVIPHYSVRVRTEDGAIMTTTHWMDDSSLETITKQLDYKLLEDGRMFAPGNSTRPQFEAVIEEIFGSLPLILKAKD